MTSLLTFSVISLSASTVISSSISSSCPCSDPFSHCDTFENKCLSCKDICENEATNEDCKAYCSHYLQSVFYIHKMEKDDLHTLTVMVALTAGMTSVVMIAVFMLIIMKLKKRNRIKKKILPSSVFTVEKEKVDIDVSQRSLKEGDNSKLPGQTMVPLKTGTSMSTMITQLSQDSSILQNQSINNNLRRSFDGYSKRRQPSEDCIPESGGQFHLSMSPDSRSRTLPHSQVV